jgi:hypothetical protein
MIEQPDQTADRISRVVDFKIPLIYLISGVISLGWVLISMWFSVGQLVKTVDDLQITVKSGNSSVVAVAGELALLKFRLQNVEDTVKRTSESKNGGGR